jgi:hypothetical protein
MFSRAFLATVSAAATLAALPARAVHAQVRTPVPPPARTLTPTSGAMPGVDGVGPYGVTFKSVTGATTDYGRATSVTFNLPAPAGGGGLGGVSRTDETPGTVVIQFAPNDQQAQQASTNACLLNGCQGEMDITYVQGNETTTYKLKQLHETQVQLGSGVTATFSFEQYMEETQRTAAQTGGLQPAATGNYNLGTVKAP